MGKALILGSNNNKNELPYIELEYIESTGTQYIDTGFKPNQNTRVVMSYMGFSTADGGMLMYGAGGTSYTDRTFECYVWSNALQFNYGGKDNFLGVAKANDKVLIDHNKNNVSYIYNSGSSYSADLGTATFQAPVNMILFGDNRNGTLSYTRGRIYSVKIYDNGVLIRDFIPVINAQSMEVGLFNKINNTFYKNAGTGAFKYAFKSFAEASKVLDFNINYIQSHGQQHMSTGLITKEKHWFDITMQFDVINDYMFTFGVWANLSVGAKNDKLVIGGGATEMNLSSYTVTTGKTYNIISGQANTIVDGVSIQNATHNNTPGAELYLFSNNYIWDSTYGYSRSKIYSLKLYNGIFNDRNNSILERDYIPFKFKDLLTCGLYDKVENKIYLNAGSGSFTFG